MKFFKGGTIHRGVLWPAVYGTYKRKKIPKKKNPKVRSRSEGPTKRNSKVQAEVEQTKKGKSQSSKRRDLQKKKIQGRIRSEAYKKNKIPKSNSK